MPPPDRCPEPRPGAAHRAGRPGVPRPAAHRCRRCAPSPARSRARRCSRSTRSTCSSARTTCRSSAGWVPTTRRCCTRAAEREPRRLVEYWAHVAAFMPVELWPHMRHRMRDLRARAGTSGTASPAAPELVASLLAEVARARRRRPPATSTTGCPACKEHWGWNWSETKRRWSTSSPRARLAVAGRNPRSSGVYDLPERVLPARGARRARRRRSSEATVELVRRGRRPHGVATAQRPARLLPDAARSRRKPALDDAGRGGRAAAGRGRGLAAPAYLHRDAALPRRVDARALLSPFDPVVWGRDAHRAALRLPLPDRDLRPGAPSGCTATTCCRSCSATASSPGSTSRRTAGPARCSSRRLGRARGARRDRRGAGRRAARLAGWLGLDGVVVRPTGDLAPRCWPRSTRGRSLTDWPRRLRWPGSSLRPVCCSAPAPADRSRHQESHARACHHRQDPPHRRGQDPPPAGGDRARPSTPSRTTSSR